MARNLRKFNTYSDYETAELVRPAVSLVVSPRKVYFDPINPTPPTPTFDGKWKATYSNGNVTSAECDSSSAITSGEIELTDLVSVEIGDCVTSIDDFAFTNCSGLTSCTIGSGITDIGYSAFENCFSLTSCTIGSGVTFIDNAAFFSCSGLTSITMPNSVTSIGNDAFNKCSGLTSITCNATTPPTLGYYTFYATNDCPIYVPSGSVSAYQSDSDWSEYARRIQAIPNS